MPVKTCPVCRLNKIYRRDQATCGLDCAEQWRYYPAEKKARARELADESPDIIASPRVPLQVPPQVQAQPEPKTMDDKILEMLNRPKPNPEEEEK